LPIDLEEKISRRDFFSICERLQIVREIHDKRVKRARTVINCEANRCLFEKLVGTCTVPGFREESVVNGAYRQVAIFSSVAQLYERVEKFFIRIGLDDFRAHLIHFISNIDSEALILNGRERLSSKCFFNDGIEERCP